MLILTNDVGVFAHLQSQLQRDFEKCDVRQAVHQCGDLERILCQFEDVRRGVNVFLDGLQDRLEPATVTWKEDWDTGMR